jgi:hypothetical protein
VGTPRERDVKTLLLDQEIWDLVKDAAGNIAVAANPYAIAQDVASAVRVFRGEVWYDTAQGMPYLQQILGEAPPIELVKSQLASVGMTTPEVTHIDVFITAFEGRELSGQLKITDNRGNTLIAGSASLQGPVPWYVSAAVPF